MKGRAPKGAASSHGGTKKGQTAARLDAAGSSERFAAVDENVGEILASTGT